MNIESYYEKWLSKAKIKFEIVKAAMFERFKEMQDSGNIDSALLALYVEVLQDAENELKGATMNYERELNRAERDEGP